MKTRLQEFITREGLTAAKLAEIVGVQPSAISHILSGRNYPRFDFLHNLLRAYPDMNARWLLLGEDDIYTQSGFIRKTPNSPEDKVITTKESEQQQNKEFLNDNSSSKPEVAIQTNKQCKHLSNKEKNIDKVIIFYEDGTFSMYENK